MESNKTAKKAVFPTTITSEMSPVIEKIRTMSGGVDKKVEIKIVGSIADKDEVDILKGITEVFIIERRIRDLFVPIESESSLIV